MNRRKKIRNFSWKNPLKNRWKNAKGIAEEIAKQQFQEESKQELLEESQQELLGNINGRITVGITRKNPRKQL